MRHPTVVTLNRQVPVPGGLMTYVHGPGVLHDDLYLGRSRSQSAFVEKGPTQ